MANDLKKKTAEVARKHAGGEAPFGFHLNKGVDPNAAWSVSTNPPMDKETGLPTIIKEELDDDAAVRRNMKKQDADINRRESAERADQEFAAQQQQRELTSPDWQGGSVDARTGLFEGEPTRVDYQPQTKRTATRTLDAGAYTEGKYPVLGFEEAVAEHFENLSQWDLWNLIKQDMESKRRD